MTANLVGRWREWTLLTRLLAGVSDQESAGDPADLGSEHPLDATLVVRGPAGIGKTHLLRCASTEASSRGFRVRSCAGRQRDRDAPLSALEELLGSEFSDFGASDLASPNPDDHLPAAMQALRIVLNWAQDGPVLLVVDDAQWIDRPSWEALLFVLRRIRDDPVMVLAAVTSGTAGDERLDGADVPAVTLGPLAAADAERLLTRTAPDLPGEVAAIVLRESAGLPLALVELGAAAGRDDAEVIRGSLPVTDRLEQTYARALTGLPQAAAVLLRILSVGDVRASAELLAAASHYLRRPVELAELQPAVEARLVELSTDGFQLWFASPTARAVVSALTPAADRHRMHLAWAEAITAAEPDRALWHRAAGTLGPDERLEADLVALAERAVGRDDLDVAAEALEQASRFAYDPQRAAHLMLRAAGLSIELDDPDRSQRLVDAVNTRALGPVDRARLRWLTSMLGESWSGADSLPGFIESARQMHQAGADQLAFDALMGVCLRFHFSNPAIEVRQSAESLLDALDLDTERDLQRIGGLGLVAPEHRGRDVLARIARTPASTVGEAESLVMLGYGALAVGDPVAARAYLVEAEARCRPIGRLGTLARVLVTLSFTAALAGRTGQARSYGAEGRALAEETGQTRWVVTADLALGYVAALRGDAEEAERLASSVEPILTAVGLFPMLAYVELTRGIVAAAAGDPARAVEHLARPFQPSEPCFHPQVRFWGLTQLAFAAVSSRRTRALDGAVEVARSTHTEVPAALLSTGLAFVEAVRAGEADAPRAYESALAAISPDWPFERARLQLGYGNWLRRHRRQGEARAQLTSAAAAFTALGTRPWAASAQRELQSAGGAGGRSGSAADALSPQELQVADLVSDGLTNRQIAERLFVSPRTIESHLYRIYAKVGAANRTDLVRLLSLDSPPL